MNQLGLSVCVIYKKPAIALSILNQDIETVLPYLPYDSTIIGGDFNINVIDQPYRVRIQALEKHGFSQVITTPTTTGGTLLDHIYLRRLPVDNESGVLQTYYSYHDAIYYILS